MPATATAGPLTVTDGGSTLGPIAFRRASFALGLQPFWNAGQESYARQDPQLEIGRYFPTSAVIGNYVYIIGGHGGATQLASVERALINADGTVGQFADTGKPLQTARYLHSSIVVGGYLYVMGGIGAAGELTSVERAPINADGSLGAFVTLTDTPLQAVQVGQTNLVIGDQLYVIGGTGIESARRSRPTGRSPRSRSR